MSFEVTIESVNDGETLIAVGIYGSRFVEQQRRKHDFQSGSLS